MRFLNFISKFAFLFILISALLTLAAFASDYSELYSEFIELGIDSSVIAAENEFVTSSKGSEFIDQFAMALSFNVRPYNFAGEYVTDGEYISAMLNILGYSVNNGDFIAEFPYDKAAEVGLLTSFDASTVYLTGGEMLTYTAPVLAYFNSEASSGSEIVGLTNYYDATDSENFVEFMNWDSNSVLTNKKFEISVCQGDGRYFSDAKFFCIPKLTSPDSLYRGEYFSGIAYSGESITINVEMRSDIKSGYKILSNKASFEASFSDGILSIAVSEPQILQVIYDDAAGKTLTIFVFDKNNASGNDVVEFFNQRNFSVLTNIIETDMTYTYPAKIIIGNTICYYPTLVVGGKIYLPEELYGEEYSGNITTDAAGRKYISYDAFSGTNGFGECTYNADLGLLEIAFESINASSSIKDLSGPCALTNAMTGAITFGSDMITDSDFCGIFAHINNNELFAADCLRLNLKLVMRGSTFGLPLKFSILACDEFGDSAVISSGTVNAYTIEKDSVMFFDISGNSDGYEAYYLVITAGINNGVFFTVSDAVISSYVPSGIGDNEFNPFA